MTLVELLHAARNITTTLSLVALLGAAYLWYASSRRERSLVEDIAEPSIPNAREVLRILKVFRDDSARLGALQSILQNNETLAKHVLQKVKGNIDTNVRTVRQQNSGTLTLIIIGGVLVVLAFVGFASAPQHGPAPTGTIPGSAAPSVPPSTPSAAGIPSSNTGAAASASAKSIPPPPPSSQPTVSAVALTSGRAALPRPSVEEYCRPYESRNLDKPIPDECRMLFDGKFDRIFAEAAKRVRP